MATTRARTPLAKQFGCTIVKIHYNNTVRGKKNTVTGDNSFTEGYDNKLTGDSSF
jgi:hypothetical protein